MWSRIIHVIPKSYLFFCYTHNPSVTGVPATIPELAQRDTMAEEYLRLHRQDLKHRNRKKIEYNPSLGIACP